MLFSVSLALASQPDQARPTAVSTTRLSAEPHVWMTHDFFSPETVEHMLSRVPSAESAYSPCIGQVDEFESKRCTLLPAAGDALIDAALAKVEAAYDLDASRLRAEGVPLIRYLPGAPPVGKHGDEDKHGVVPNATLVVYLTPSTGSGQTIFPDADLRVDPRPGAVLSFTNVGADGKPHPKAKHWVSAVPADAPRDRLVLQIPIAVEARADGTVRRYAYPEHVSGGKKPGQHESMHGNDAQKAAAAAATAAGFGIAIAYMAAKQGEFKPEDYDDLKGKAAETGKFTEEEMSAPPK